MYINNTNVNGRFNRPSVLTKTGLVAYFISNGQYTDPYVISAVSIFKASNNFYPSSVIGSDGQILNSASSLVLLNFANTSGQTTTSGFDVSNYIGSQQTGIYKLRTGVFAVVLDGDITQSTFNLSGSNTISNGLSSTGDYIDVWTIKRSANSNFDTVINEFSLYEDTFTTVTEPLLFRVATRLVNKYINLGSKEDLKFTNDVTIENLNIDDSINNIFKTALVMNPQIEIYKENSERGLPARVSVSSFAQTSSLCDVTSDNTVVFSFDTNALLTHPQLLAGDLGGPHGTYLARLKFTALNQTFYSNFLGFIVR